ncbi:MAG: QueT transporter family protein [Lachnospiraceae bacterium]|nr:QueT transporter family protein [Lachnospiraceae bacterium]
MTRETKKVVFWVYAAVIAALYVVLTEISAALGLASGVIQVRLSEALTILPYFTPAAVPGLFVGCLLSNVLTGSALWDVVFGSLATMLGALGSYALRRYRNLVWIPPVLANVLIVPWVLQLVYGVKDTIGFLMITVGAGEVVACGVFGTLLMTALERQRRAIFVNE